MSRAPVRVGTRRNGARVRALLRSGVSTCCWCGCPVGTRDRPATLEHLWPLSFGGDNSPANLRLACDDCNSRNEPSRERVAHVPDDALRAAIGRLYQRCTCSGRRGCWRDPQCLTQRWVAFLGRELVRRRKEAA
jgi:hypothetical protein